MDLLSPENLYSRFPTATGPEDLSEDFLLQQLDSNHRGILWAATVLLQTKATSKAITPLRACCLKPFADVQVSALAALRTSGDPQIGAFAAQMLGKAAYREKWAAMLMACQEATADALPALEARVKTLSARPRAAPVLNGVHGKTTEVLAFFDYLHRTGQNLSAPLRALLIKRKAHLTDEEISRLEETE